MLLPSWICSAFFLLHSVDRELVVRGHGRDGDSIHVPPDKYNRMVQLPLMRIQESLRCQVSHSRTGISIVTRRYVGFNRRGVRATHGYVDLIRNSVFSFWRKCHTRNHHVTNIGFRPERCFSSQILPFTVYDCSMYLVLSVSPRSIKRAIKKKVTKVIRHDSYLFFLFFKRWGC